jgi:hypothetical protein
MLVQAKLSTPQDFLWRSQVGNWLLPKEIGQAPNTSPQNHLI